MSGPQVEELAAGELVVERYDTFWRVILNRPQVRNAFSENMFAALEQVCSQVRSLPQVHAVVFQGAGGTFCAGNDISGFTRHATGSARLQYEKRIRSRVLAVGALPQVTIAAVDGACVGAGMSLATQCDVRISTRSGRFGYPIARTLGNVLAGEVLLASRRVVGDALTRQMLLCAELIPAQRLFECGAVAQLVDTAADLDEAALAMAERMSTLSPVTLRATKAQLLALDLDTLTTSRDDALLDLVFASSDFEAAVAAFEQRSRHQFQQTELATYLHRRLTD